MDPALVANLDLTAHAVTAALSAANCRHAFIGGYAVTALGGERSTQDVDLIINEPGEEIRALLLESDNKFSMSEYNKLRYTPSSAADTKNTVDVELLRGGADFPLKLPDITTAPIHFEEDKKGTNARQSPTSSPQIAHLTKLKRWRFIADSTRPQSQQRAAADRHDIGALLRWLVDHGALIDFEEYGAKPRLELLPGFQELYSKCPELRIHLDKVLTQEDLDFMPEIHG